MIANGVKLIAEVKTMSPFGWKSDQTWEQLFNIANESSKTDILSIHTDPSWGGSMELIAKARKRTTKPILAKGIHENDSLVAEALSAGASYVLVVGRIPNTNRELCLIEPWDLEDLRTLPQSAKAVWNSRDLRNSGKRKTETFAQARSIFPGWLCQASNIKTVNDIEPGANAVLVGQHLPGFLKSLNPM